MKKNDKKIEDKLSQDLEKYYKNIEVPELNVEKQEELKNHIKQNKSKRKKIPLWKKITAAASAVCLITLIIIPTVILLNRNDNPKNPPATRPIYYGKDEATKIEHNLEETQEIIYTNFSKYNFMFTDLIYVSSMGFYNPKDNSLLALQIYFNESVIPYTQVEIHIITSKQFVFDDKDTYTKQAEFTETTEYKMYKKTNPDPFNGFQSGYIIFDNHEIYFKLTRINEELFNKFI